MLRAFVSPQRLASQKTAQRDARNLPFSFASPWFVCLHAVSKPISMAPGAYPWRLPHYPLSNGARQHVSADLALDAAGLQLVDLQTQPHCCRHRHLPSPNCTSGAKLFKIMFYPVAFCSALPAEPFPRLSSFRLPVSRCWITNRGQQRAHKASAKAHEAHCCSRPPFYDRSKSTKDVLFSFPLSFSPFPLLSSVALSARRLSFPISPPVCLSFLKQNGFLVDHSTPLSRPRVALPRPRPCSQLQHTLVLSFSLSI